MQCDCEQSKSSTVEKAERESLAWFNILDTHQTKTLVAAFHKAQSSKAYSQKCPQYFDLEIHSEKSRPFWPSQNDSLRKTVFGICKSNTLPNPVLRNSENDKVRSFFVQRCIVYHNALYEKSPELKMNQKCVMMMKF